MNRPFEKNDTQNLAHSISEGTHQVVAQVSEDGSSCLCKDVLKLHITYELVMPASAESVCIDNEIGMIFEENGIWKILFKKLQTSNGKQFDEIHSGNIHAIVLPTPVAGFSFLRLHIKDK